jgi:DNA-binding winged helix-turn-helix (wHTH) protein
MEVLLLMLERPHRLITRAEIAQRVWGDDVFVDVDTGVNTLIGKVRQALRDSSDTPRFIETVARKGYRFVASMQAPEVPTPLPTPEGPTALAMPAPASRSPEASLRTIALPAGAALSPGTPAACPAGS